MQTDMRENNPFGLWSNPKLAWALGLSWLVIFTFFALRPELDLAFAASFFDPALCAETARDRYCSGFPATRSADLVRIREILHHLPTALAIIALVAVIVDFARGVRLDNTRLRLTTALAGAFILGPGLIVNGVLKPYSGRPRPWMSEEFGGWMPFEPVGDFGGQCDFNCSFISGEASGGGWLVCLTVLLPRKWRIPAGLVFAATGIFMAILRTAFGAHFLSDVMLGWLISPLIFAVLANRLETRYGSPR